jgi:hypothetical protein
MGFRKAILGFKMSSLPIIFFPPLREIKIKEKKMKFSNRNTGVIKYKQINNELPRRWPNEN